MPAIPPRRRRVASWRAACAPLALLVLTAACGSDEPALETGNGDVRIIREGESVTLHSEERGMEGRFGPGAELPDDFPDDVPVPGGAEIVGVMRSERDGTMLSLRSEASREALLDEMRGALGEQGWTIEEDTAVMGQFLLSASKGDRSLVMQVMGADGAARVMMHLGEESG